MVLRFLIHFFRTRLGEQAVDKLAESPPFRRAARFVIQVFLQSKSLLPPDTSPEKIREALFKSKKLQDIASRVKDEFEKRAKKF